MQKNYHQNRNFWLSAFSGMTTGIANHCLIIVLPVYVLDLGGTNAITGTMLSVMTVAMIITRLMIGNLIDTWGRKQMAVLGSILYLINIAGYLFVTDIPGLFVMRVLNGVTQGIYFPVQPVLVADATPKEKMVSAIGVFSIICTIPVAFASTLGLTLYNAVGAKGMFIAGVAGQVLSVIWAFLLKNDYVPSGERIPLRKRLMLTSNIDLTVIWPCLVFTLVSIGNCTTSSFLTPCGLERGIANVAQYFTIATVATVILRAATGKLAGKFGAWNLMASSPIYMAAGLVVLAFTYSFMGVAVASVLATIGYVFVAQIGQAKVLSMVPDNRKGVAGNTWTTLTDIGVGFGTFAWGLASSAWGYPAMFLLAAAVTMIGFFVQLAKVPKEQ